MKHYEEEYFDRPMLTFYCGACGIYVMTSKPDSDHAEQGLCRLCWSESAAAERIGNDFQRALGVLKR